jgi:phosphonoacetaldehyde hydrolase
MSQFRTSHSHRGPLLAVVFDWAGTVLDYGSRAPVLAIVRTFADHGVPVTTDEARGPMGMAKLDHVKALLAAPRIADRWRQVHGAMPGADAVDRLYRAFLESQQALLVDHAQLIPGCVETAAWCRQRGLRLGSSTGYTSVLMKPLIAAARDQGLEFDAVVCADDVPQGRPAPWMLLENARRLDAFPIGAIVAVDDTTVGIEAGLNAGMWTVGVAKSGNLVGLTEREFASLDAADQRMRLQSAYEQLQDSGAHFVIDTVADLPGVLDQIEASLHASNKP